MYGQMDRLRTNPIGSEATSDGVGAGTVVVAGGDGEGTGVVEPPPLDPDVGPTEAPVVTAGDVGVVTGAVKAAPVRIDTDASDPQKLYTNSCPLSGGSHSTTSGPAR
jgi:hypothetical protein